MDWVRTDDRRGGVKEDETGDEEEGRRRRRKVVDGRVEWVEEEDDEREIGHGDDGSGWSDGTSVPEAVSSGASTASTASTAAEGVRKAGFAECDALWVRDDIPILPESRPPFDHGEWTGLLMWTEEGTQDGEGNTGTSRRKGQQIKEKREL